MKRNLLFAAALLAGVAVSAQEIGEMDFSQISSETPVVVPAGTTVAATATGSYTVATAFDLPAGWKTLGCNTDEFEKMVIDGTEVDVAQGVTGEDGNPASALGNPANNYDVPISGACYKFTAPGDLTSGKPCGYFYAFGKLSPNKQYWVVESSAAGTGDAIGYELHMVSVGEVYHFTLTGNENGYLNDDCVKASYPDLAATGWTGGTPSLDQMLGFPRGGSGLANGLGYVKFPMYEGMTYYFGAAGSKMSLCGFCVDPEGDAVISLRDADGVVGDLQISPAGEGNAIDSVESAAEVVAEEYYTVSGIRVAEMVPGLNLVKQTLSDGSVKTVKVIK